MMRQTQNHYPAVWLLHRIVLMPRYEWWAPQHPLHELVYEQIEMHRMWLSLHFHDMLCHLSERKIKKENWIFIDTLVSGSSLVPHKILLKRQYFIFACDTDICPKEEYWDYQSNFESRPYVLHVWTSFPWKAEYQRRGRVHTSISC